MSTVAMVASLDEIAQTMTDKINIVISGIEEIITTQPKVVLRLTQNQDGILLVADISFVGQQHVSPMEYAEQLIATELIMVIINNHYSK